MNETNEAFETTIDEIADGIWRISTPVEVLGGFSFNQYLVVDEQPLLFHTGLKQMFPQIKSALSTVIDPATLRYIAFSHFEADECGSLNDWLEIAPQAVPLCSQLAAMLSVNDTAIRPAQPMADEECLSLGHHEVKWLDAPHLPHGWETGYLMETTTQTLFCGDLFTQGGYGKPALVETDILDVSEAFRAPMDYYAHGKDTGTLIEKLAREEPGVLAVMHGSAWRGDGAWLLRELRMRLTE